MRVFSCPAKYEKYVTASLALALTEIARDVSRRTGDNAGMRDTIHHQFRDDTKTGTLTILVGVGNHEAAAAQLLLTAGATV